MPENPLSDAAKAAAEKVPLWAKATNSKVGQLIVNHPGKATSIAALVTAMAIWLWPGKKQEPQADGSEPPEKKWGFGKKAAVTVGSILTAGLLAHYIPRGPTASWVSKIGEKAAKLSPKGI